jgi:translation elongation factor EF-G
MAEMLTYGADLTAMTQARGSFRMEMDHYDSREYRVCEWAAFLGHLFQAYFRTAISVRPKSVPLASSGSPVALARA